VQLAERSRLHFEHDTCGDWELGAFDAPLETAIENFAGLLGEQAVLVGERRRLPSMQRRRRDCGRDLALGKVDILFRKGGEGCCRKAEVLGEQLLGACPIQSEMLNVPNSEK
jgi:hypothetical protein